ncbi:polysaccharide pyruvyl transferase family protein [Klenkia brasiliensis]|nr:polysaccharide pyruvyl transferase family protein [Klenkia brasiliensis]
MSMQRIKNYGSSLQAFALSHTLRQIQPNAEVRFIDYEPGDPLIGPGTGPRGSKIGLAGKLSKALAHAGGPGKPRNKIAFLNHKRSYDRRYFSQLDITPERDLGTEVDLQIIGSDEVFNCVQPNPDVGYARQLFGHGSSASTLASYAASFGNTTMDKIVAAGIKAELASDLRRFAALSVRDQNSRAIVQELIGTDPELHLDPTLIHEFSPQHLVHAKRPKPYVVVYGYSGRFSESESRTVQRYAKNAGLEIVFIGGIQPGEGTFVDCSPLEVLSYFAGAQAVVTDTFHGTIFSVISKTPFVSLIRRSRTHGYGNEEKLTFLLEQLGLRGRGLYDVDQLTEVLPATLDFDLVSSRIDEQRLKSRQYLGRLMNPVR